LNSSIFEKNKAICFGNSIRDHDYIGEAKVEIVVGDE